MKLVKCRECGEVKKDFARGLCSRCYKREYYRCNREHILEQNKKYRKNNYEAIVRYHRKRRDAGLCYICGKPLDYSVSVIRCPSCHFRRLDFNNKKRLDNFLGGVCMYCGKRPLYTNRRCFECNNRRNEYQRLPDVSGDLEKASVFVEGLDD